MGVLNTRERVSTRIDQSGGSDACWPWTGGQVSKSGHVRVMWHYKRQFVHRLILGWASGISMEEADRLGLQTRHLCGNPSCQNPKHLTWGTGSENYEDQRRHGRAAIGERQGLSVLTERKVRLIRALYASLKRYPKGKVIYGSAKKVADLFGINEGLLHQVVARRIWKHVGEGV